MTRLLALFGLVPLVALSSCTSLERHYPDIRYPAPNRGEPVYERNRDVRRTAEWRRADNDARRYAHRLDRDLGLTTRQEHRIRDLLEGRTYDLLYRTSPRDHRYVYPFPRSYDRAGAANWWERTDRLIDRQLDRYQRAEYQYLTGRRRDRPYIYHNGRWYSRHDSRGRGSRGGRGREYDDDRYDDDRYDRGRHEDRHERADDEDGNRGRVGGVRRDD